MTPSSLERMSASVMTWRPLPPHEHSPLICERERSGFSAGEQRRRGWGKNIPSRWLVRIWAGGSPNGGEGPSRGRGVAPRASAHPGFGFGTKEAFGANPARSGGDRGDRVVVRFALGARDLRVEAFQTRRPIGSGESFAYLDRDVLL